MAPQSGDLDGDGQHDATSSDTSVRTGVTPTPVAQTIAPTNGTYSRDGQASSANGFAVQGDEVKVKVRGTFTPDGDATVDASWPGVLGAGGPKCAGALPTDSPYRLVAP
jgi:hypothetical protein